MTRQAPAETCVIGGNAELVISGSIVITITTSPNNGFATGLATPVSNESACRDVSTALPESVEDDHIVRGAARPPRGSARDAWKPKVQLSTAELTQNLGELSTDLIGSAVEFGSRASTFCSTQSTSS
jgi:hypothetical protein